MVGTGNKQITNIYKAAVTWSPRPPSTSTDVLTFAGGFVTKHAWMCLNSSSADGGVASALTLLLLLLYQLAATIMSSCCFSVGHLYSSFECRACPLCKLTFQQPKQAQAMVVVQDKPHGCSPIGSVINSRANQVTTPSYLAGCCCWHWWCGQCCC